MLASRWRLGPRACWRQPVPAVRALSPLRALPPQAARGRARPRWLRHNLQEIPMPPMNKKRARATA